MRKVISAAVMGIAISLTLTACDPPMPESLRVELEEREVRCADGSVELAGDLSFADLTMFWNESVSLACPNMNFEYVDSLSTGTGLVVSNVEATQCQPTAVVPLAIDAAVLVFMLGDFYELTLTPEALGKILNGEITNWADPALEELNQGFGLPDQEIIISPTAPAGVTAAMQTYLADFGIEVDLSYITEEEIGVYETDKHYELMDGEVRLSTFTAVSDSGMPYAVLQEDAADVNSRVSVDKLSLFSAATQLNATSDLEAKRVSVVRDPAKSPLPPEGSTDVVLPYGPIMPVLLSVCGGEQEAYFGRYLIRLDAQGQFASGLHVVLPDPIRIKSAVVLDSMLPVVEVSTE